MKSWWAIVRLSGWRQYGVGLVALMAGLWLLCPKPQLYPDEWAFSRTMSDRHGKLMHLATTPDGKYRLYTKLDQISPEFIRTTVQFEDHRFYKHHGVSLTAVARAVWGVLSGQRLGGGSTLTMQLARLRWQLQTDTVLGKAAQMLRALQLERHYTKNEILEAYFNIAPYGGNVEGIGAASLLWCDKSALKLDARESVALAVLPQSPTARKPRPGKSNPRQTEAAQRLWSRITTRPDTLDSSYSLVPESKVPRGAPHYARRIFKESSNINVHSTLDADQQITVETALHSFIQSHRDVGIVNGAALLMHAPSREFRAYVGSADFFSEALHGQVDGITAKRSPGSALKPFVYALALDQGLIHTRTLLKDGRLEYADYTPENFDRDFIGPIPAQEALFRSRNIPAIVLTQQLQPPGLYGYLQSSGVRLAKPAEHYGLSIALGGAEVTMEELARLYSGLACGDGHLSDAARFLTMEMLRLPPNQHLVNAGGKDNRSIAWKTGTSHGFRDAWCAGIQGDYVLVVWLGNFQGKGNPALVARQSAAPLLFEMFDRLKLPNPMPPTPATVAKVDLCAVSGQLPGKYCQHRVQGWFIPGVSAIKACEIHQEVITDAESGLRLAQDDGKRKVTRQVMELWPPDLMEMFRQAGLPRRAVPNWAPGETPDSMTSAGPRIRSPIPQRVYAVQSNTQGRKAIPLRADTAAGVKQVYWFADDRYLGSAKPVEPLMWEPTPGHWSVQVTDDAGRTARCVVTVE